MGKYIPILQWIRKNNRIVGIKDLYLVHTCESDYWIKKKNNKYEVYDCNLGQRELICGTMAEAIQHIKDVSKANILFYDTSRK